MRILTCAIALFLAPACIWVSGGEAQFAVMSQTVPSGALISATRVTGEHCGQAGGLDFVRGYRYALLKALRKAKGANALANVQLATQETLLGDLCILVSGQPMILE